MSTLIFILAAAVLFALVEVQIEGPNGWAVGLPTWRIDNKWTRLFWDKKPLTGYHLYLNLFMLLMVHLPFGLELVPFHWRLEARILSSFIAFWVVEDFAWFILNPAYGLKRFRKECIWWHAKSWWWIMPKTYWVFTPIAIGLYHLSLA